jgi:hypothetical protein
MQCRYRWQRPAIPNCSSGHIFSYTKFSQTEIHVTRVCPVPSDTGRGMDFSIPLLHPTL